MVSAAVDRTARRGTHDGKRMNVKSDRQQGDMALVRAWAGEIPAQRETKRAPPFPPELARPRSGLDAPARNGRRPPGIHAATLEPGAFTVET